MNYESALEYIHSANKFGIKLGLANITKLLAELGNPQQNKKIIHVAGTNGKGSTCAMIASVLREQGYKTGLYISPFLEVFNERIQINGENITNEELAESVEKVRICADKIVREGHNSPTEFELVTAAAFYYFNLKKVDFIVLEVGMGGRFDATNVIEKPLISVITKISMDHMAYLGNTLKEIAFEKCGIIKANSMTVAARQFDDAYEVIEKICTERSSILKRADSIKLEEVNFDGEYSNLIYSRCGEDIHLKLKLLGEYQIENLKTVLKVFEGLAQIGIKIDDQNLYNGIAKTQWPGRFEVVSNNPVTILDGAHNDDGMKAFLNSVDKYFKNKKKVLVLGILKDKEYNKMVIEASKVFHKIIFTEPVSERKASSDELKKIVANQDKDFISIADYREAADYAIAQTGKDEILCFAGSLFLIGAVRTYLFKNIYKGGSLHE